MKNISIPKDIRNYVRKKVIFNVLFFVCLEALAVVINVSLFEELRVRLNVGIHILLIIALQIIPFFISKFPFSVIDKSWRGEVVAVNINTKTDAFFAGGKSYSYTNHQIMLDVKKENNKVVKIKAKEVGEPNPETTWLLGYTVPNQGHITAFINYYSVGDTVYHFYGIPHYYIAKKQSDKNDCVICGTQNSSERDTCLNCGYSLIKADGIISFKKAPRLRSKP